MYRMPASCCAGTLRLNVLDIHIGINIDIEIDIDTSVTALVRDKPCHTPAFVLDATPAYLSLRCLPI